MPTEIADSDAESDFEVQLTPHRAPDHAHGEMERPTTYAFDGTIDVNFDDFISQTQSIARPSTSPSEPTNTRSTSSTKKLLNGIQDAQIGLAGNNKYSPIYGDDVNHESSNKSRRKRGRTEIDGSPVFLRDGGGEAVESRRKRSKTYGTSSQHLTWSQDMYSSSRNENESHKSPAGGAVEEDEDVLPQQRNRLSTTVSLRRDSDPNSHMIISTSRSSMGGHESITLDLRGSGNGMDINPFGTPSQVSVDGVHRLVDQEALNRDAFDDGKPSSTIFPTNLEQELADAEDALKIGDDHLLAVTQRSRSAELSLSMLDLPHDTQLLTPLDTISSRKNPDSDKAKAGLYGNRLNTEMAIDLHTLAVENASFEPSMAIKKRGHEVESSRLSSAIFTPDTVEQEEPHPDKFTIELPRAHGRPERSQSRSSTADPQAQVVEHGREALHKKGRKRSLKAPAADPGPGSPVKQLTSELNLSDEAVIGLPKENYKPRPSRRRSKIIGEEEGLSVTEAEPQLDETEMRQEAVFDAQKAKKGKKTKIKRAKTSAIALARKSEPMVSDGEEDVLWLDTKPATVKLHLAPDPLSGRVVKEEDIVAVERPVEEESKMRQAEREHTVPSSSAEAAEAQTVGNERLTGKITIEIPAAKHPPPEPKKRSGTRKSTRDTTDEAKREAVAPEATITPAQPQRQVLSDIDPNTPRLPSSHSNGEPENSTPQLINPTDTADLPDNAQVDNETKSTPPSNRLKAAAAASCSSPSPAKSSRQTHSPINPTGGKVVYRVGLSRHRPIPPLLKMVKKPEPKAKKAPENSDDDAVRQTLEIYRKSGLLDS